MPSPRVLIRVTGGLFVVVLAGVAAQGAELLTAETGLTVAAGAAALGLVVAAAALRARPSARDADRVRFGEALLSSETLACYTLDRDGRVGSWSRGAEALLGWSAAEMEELTITGTIHPRAQEAELLAEIRRLLESGRPHAPHICALTNREGRAVETVCVMVPLEEPGAPKRVAVMHVDPHSPQLVEGRWSRLFHAAPAGLLRIDAAGRIEVVNRRFTDWTGRKAEALEGIDVDRSELFPEDFRERIRSAAIAPREGRGTQTPFECTVTLVGPEGAPRPYLAIVAPRPGAGADVVLVDGTARERLRDERDAARAAAEAAQQSASETVTTQRDLTSSVAQLMTALDSAGETRTKAGMRPEVEKELKRSGQILLANIERLREGGGRGGPGAKPQVLLVEDNDANRDLIAHMLASRGAAVTSVASGREALDAVGQAWFDVVLLDLQMPEMDGYEVVRRIRALPGGKAISVVALTALGAEGIRERCLAEGMDDFVNKPLTFAKVSEILTRWGSPQARG